ncbi:hypothetical protein EBCG_04358 [Escherichia marmotae]|nr:hypothetical protein EBCG_04358 [Escherichia marmotae]
MIAVAKTANCLFYGALTGVLMKKHAFGKLF